MIGNLLAGAISLAQPQLAEAPYAHPSVKQVVCSDARGTAFKVGPNKYLSVNHVTARSGCAIEGKPIFVTHADPGGDFSILSVDDPSPGGIEISCEGFRPKEWYYSVGFARGDPWSVVISIKASELPTVPGLLRGWSGFQGIEFVIPGMSGGVVMDLQGRAVGTVNAYNPIFGLSWSRPLSETALCK